ncbi:hypothetical protein F5Y11DRAFT_277583 [Daldinia sp. FL1419]|nr:hypothetical protein F5Y11DRAFT_277583 [Daldinia sp. FL1419]
MCRYNLTYRCGDVISKYFLRPGVTIQTDELENCCPLYSYEQDRHTVPEAGRPICPLIYGNWDIIRGQLERLGATGMGHDMVLPHHVTHPTAFLFNDHDDEDPYAPPNIIPTDGELHLLNDVSVFENLRQFRRMRPRRHKFHFKVRPEDETPLEDDSPFTRETFIMSLEGDKTSIMDAQIDGLQKKFDDLHEVGGPGGLLLVTPASLQMLRTAFEKLKAKYNTFRREHEGHLQLSPVAIKYRDDCQMELQVRMDDVWDRFDWIRKALDEEVDSWGLTLRLASSRTV